MDFEWDNEKAKLNIENHKVSFNEAQTAMMDIHALTLEDGTYEGETRYRTIGLSRETRVLVVVWTFRGDNIRIISAWKADKKRRDEYANR